MERYQEIERTIIKTYRAHLWAPFIKALKEYELLKPNDKVAVIIDGTKESFILAKLFQELKRHSDFEFEVDFLVFDSEVVLFKANLELLAIPYKKILKYEEVDKGYVYALTSTYDDVIETTIINFLENGSFETIVPKGNNSISPLYHIRRRDITRWANYNELKFVEKKYHDEKDQVQHEKAKDLLKKLVDYNPLVEKNLFKGAYNANLDKLLGYVLDGKKISFLDEYDKKKK